MRWTLPLLLLACTGKGTPDPVDPGDDPVDTDVVVDTPDDTDAPADTDAPPSEPVTCDAGDEAWVQRVFPLLWGRRTHGAAEVAVWAGLAGNHGREAVVRAMAQDPAFRERWSSWFADELLVARTGDKNFSTCFESPALDDHDGSLAAFIRAEDPKASDYGTAFNMADVLRDALVADDISAIYKAHLLVRHGRPVQGANVPRDEMEYNRRVNFGETFYRTYLGRNPECLSCHNSLFSVTDDPDPALDRTWQLPGLFEHALFDNPLTFEREQAYAMFKVRGMLVNFFRPPGVGISPWGMDGRRCVRLEAAPTLEDDQLGDDAFFITPSDAQGSVWDVADQFARGVDRLATDGLEIGAGGELDGEAAFAWLVASNVANAVWREAHGRALTIAHDFPRTEAQRDALAEATQTFLDGDFSLQDLLVHVTTQPVFNLGLPETCGSDPYPLPRLLDPWTDAEEDETRRGNGPADLVRRHRGRVLLASVHDALGWPAPSDFGIRGEELALHKSVGVFLRQSEPGFEGTDLQGLLAFEATYGRCRYRERDDFVTVAMQTAVADQLPIGEVVAAVRDRLLGRAQLDTGEDALVEAILETPLTTTATAEHGVRALCGAMLLSPDLQLVVEPPEPGFVPRLSVGAEDDCERAADAMAAVGVDVVCNDGRPLP